MKHVKIIAAALIGAGILSAITLPGALAQASSSGESQAPANEIPAIEAPQENGDLGKAQGGAGNARGETAERGGSCHGRGHGHGHGHGAKPAEAAEPEGAIGKDAAKAAALADAGLTAEQVQKLRSRVSDKDGTTVYKVKFTYENQSYSYRIDPVSGAVLDKTVSEVTNEGHGHGAKPAEAAEPEGAIGKDAAKAAALADAGLTAEQVQKLRSRVSDKDGTTVYKVKFTYENQSYSYRIDPVSGAVLDKTVSEVTNEGHGRHGRPQSSGAMQGSVGEAAPNGAAEAAPAI